MVLGRALEVIAVADMIAKRVVMRVMVTGERISSEEVGFHRSVVVSPLSWPTRGSSTRLAYL